MKYPKKFTMSELIKMSSVELSEIESALWADWNRVSKAHKVVSQIEEEE